MASIVVCLTQHEITTPYIFKKTGVKVYSLEEALYYTYKNWQQQDFVSPAFTRWVEGILRLPDITKKLKEAIALENYSERLFAFLSITPYLDPIALATVRTEVELWQKDNISNHIKEEGDMHINESPELAIELYKKALDKGDNALAYNNLAISYMNMNMHTEALETFGKAYKADKENIDIMLNYSIALIDVGNIIKATTYIEKAEKLNKDNSYVHFLYGKLHYANKNANKSIESLKKAIKLEKQLGIKADYHYALARAFIVTRRYNEAIETIEQIAQKDETYYLKLSETYALSEDYPRAIREMLKVFELGAENVNTLTTLASYHRLNYDLTAAKATIEKALHLEKNNQLAIMEDAKIKKANGKLRDYQKIMENILTEAKENYRNSL
jgi:tetratricopeptide (TPR) repeat protein